MLLLIFALLLAVGVALSSKREERLERIPVKVKEDKRVRRR
jgi:hypothetical protein